MRRSNFPKARPDAVQQSVPAQGRSHRGFARLMEVLQGNEVDKHKHLLKTLEASTNQLSM